MNGGHVGNLTQRNLHPTSMLQMNLCLIHKSETISQDQIECELNLIVKSGKTFPPFTFRLSDISFIVFK